MATLSVWKFNDPEGANRAEEVLLSDQSKELLKVHDAATVTWEEGKKKPKTRQGLRPTATGALGGTFWGMLFGLIFFVPFLGAAVGAAAGAIGGALTDVGIDDGFINQVREQVAPGTSALFILTSDVVQDKVFADLQAHGLHPEMLHTSLSKDEEERLREHFAEGQ